MVVAVVISCLVAAAPEASAALTATGQVRGPAGMQFGYKLPMCSVNADERAEYYAYVNGWRDGWEFPSRVGGDLVGTYSTNWDIPPGTYELAIECRAVAGSGAERVVVRHGGLMFTITAPAINVELESAKAVPGGTVATTSGTRGGPQPCPQIEGRDFASVYVTLLGPARSGGFFFSEYETRVYWLDQPVTPTRFVASIPDDALPGQRFYLYVTCRALSGDSQFDYQYRYAPLDIVEPGPDGHGGCTYGPRRPGDTNCDGRVKVAVVGDSYISGEGASTPSQPYRSGTDTGGNRCHRAEQSWGVAVGRRLAPGGRVLDFDSVATSNARNSGDSIAFLACSGARTYNVDGEFVPDGKQAVQHETERAVQLERLKAFGTADLDLVFLSIGGNDAGFADVIEHCVLAACSADDDWKRERLSVLTGVTKRVADVTVRLRAIAPQAEVYHATYPDPLRPRPATCASLRLTDDVHFNVTDALSRFYGVLRGPQVVQTLPGQGITSSETGWVSEDFLPALNAAIGEASALSGAHVLDVADAFDGHEICSSGAGDDVAWAHGLTAGDDKYFVGNESFHPNDLGQAAIASRAWQRYGETTAPERFGSNPNPTPSAVESARSPDTLEVRVLGPDPDSDVFVASGSGYVVIDDAVPNTVIVVPTFSLGTVAGIGTTDANGHARIQIHVPAGAAGGLHHLELWTIDGRRLGSAPLFVVQQPGCTGAPDADQDLLMDLCDPDLRDGPVADADGDGVLNAADNCPRVSNPSQADTDGDDMGDRCDRDEVSDALAANFGATTPDPAPPTAPREVTATARAGAVELSWLPPGSEGAAAIDHYEVDVGGDVHRTLSTTDRRVTVGDLPAGTRVSAFVRAFSTAGAGPRARSALVVVPTPTPPPADDPPTSTTTSPTTSATSTTVATTLSPPSTGRPPVVLPGTPPLGSDPTPDTQGPAVRLRIGKTATATSAARVTFRLGPFAEPVSGTVALRTATKMRVATAKQRKPKATYRSLGSQSFNVKAGRTVTVTVRLNAKGRSLLKARRKLRMRMTVTVRDALGNATVKRVSVTVKAAKKKRTKR